MIKAVYFILTLVQVQDAAAEDCRGRLTGAND